MSRARVALVVAVCACLAVAYRLGVFAHFSSAAEARATLLVLGPWGYAAFVLAYATLQPFGVPGTVFILVAPLIWPWPVAFALSMTGTMAASVVGFSFARFVARDWISPRIPARFRVYDEALERRGFATVVLLRFIFWMPPLLHAFFGVSRVPFATHFWGSLVGYIVPLLVTAYFGRRVFDAMLRVSPETWASVVTAVALIAIAVWMLRRRARNA
jgi:uncharacterized membrane protein YdjX (TVP38/TMEM64 family)